MTLLAFAAGVVARSFAREVERLPLGMLVFDVDRFPAMLGNGDRLAPVCVRADDSAFVSHSVVNAGLFPVRFLAVGVFLIALGLRATLRVNGRVFRSLQPFLIVLRLRAASGIGQGLRFVRVRHNGAAALRDSGNGSTKGSSPFYTTASMGQQYCPLGRQSLQVPEVPQEVA